MAEENRADKGFAAESARWWGESPPPRPQFGLRQCKTGFRRGFSQLTFSVERGEYQPSGFPTQPRALCSRFRLGMKETCEEKL